MIKTVHSSTYKKLLNFRKYYSCKIILNLNIEKLHFQNCNLRYTKPLYPIKKIETEI